MVEALLKHLRTHALNTLVATAIVQVLGHLVTMVTEGIVGPYLTDFLKSVVLYLKTHVSRVQSSNEVRMAHISAHDLYSGSMLYLCRIRRQWKRLREN